MITLNGIVLSKDMVWVDEFGSYERVAQYATRTLGGVSVRQNQALILGMPITLVATQESGWLTKLQVEQVQTIAEIPGLICPLVIGLKSFNVEFRHDEPPAFEANPLGGNYWQDAPDTHYYIATIKLVTA